MALLVPDGTKYYEADLDQSILLHRNDRIVSGCVISAQTVPNMSVKTSAGVGLYAGKIITLAATDPITVSVADTTNPRIDLVEWDGTTGAVTIKTGTPLATPKPPSLTAGRVLVGYVSVAANASSIGSSNLSDRGVRGVFRNAVDTLAKRPAAGNIGFQYFDTTNNIEYMDDGSTWRASGFANPMTTEGDLVVGGASGVPARLAIGASGKFLSSNGTTASWGQGPLTTTGDLMLGATGGTPTRLAIGASGKILTSDGTTVAWGQGPMTTTGDLMVGATGGTPTRLAMGTALQVLRVNSGATGLEWATSSSEVVEIAESVLGADAASVDFSSIPATYSHLLVVYQVRQATGGTSTLDVLVNNDSGANYDYQRSFASDATTGASKTVGASAGQVGLCAGSGSIVGNAASGYIWIPNYRRTTFRKNMVGYVGVMADATPTGYLYWHICTWNNTAAINRLTFSVNGGVNFLAGSMFSLYGVG